MFRYLFPIVFLGLLVVCCSSALADEYSDKKLAETAVRESKDILLREMFGHYDVTRLEVIKIEDARERNGLKHDYGLVKATVQFSAKRNATKSSALKPRDVQVWQRNVSGLVVFTLRCPTGTRL
jgi:hypothetical protein